MSPRQVALAALLVVLCALNPFARAGDQEAIFARFDHEAHDRALGKAGVGCVVCHAVGAAVPAGDEALSPLEPPASACHECHAPGEGGLGSGDGLRRAPRACATCHPTVAPPTSHAAGWMEHHGAAAVGEAASCRDCHARADCVDCHDRREDSMHRVHDPSWLSVHGVEARANPGSCDSCHAVAECTACHASPGGFGRSP